MSRVAMPESLLDQIYDAAAQSSLWPEILKKVGDLVGGSGGIVFGYSPARQQVLFDYNGGMDITAVRAYRERHAANNVWVASMASQPVGKLVLSDDVVKLSDLRNTDFFDEVLRPQHVAHNAMAALALGPDLSLQFNIPRLADDGPFTPHGTALLQSLLPHIRRSLILSSQTDGYEALLGPSQNLIQAMKCGVLLFDRTRRLIFANPAVVSMADDGLFELTATGASVTSKEHDRQLSMAFQAVVNGALCTSVTLVHPDGRIFNTIISSVRGNDTQRFAWTGRRPVAVMMFISELEKQTESPEQRLIDRFGLTRAEVRVALAAAHGRASEEIASDFEVSKNTVKTHLRRIYTKTGVRRQGELMRLVHAQGSITL